MKALPNLSRLLAVCLTITASALAADPATALLNEADTALQRGELGAARAKANSARSLDPKNARAVELLKRIQIMEAGQGGGTEKIVAGLLVPSVQFREAELSAVLEALRQQVGKLSDGKKNVNFVSQLSEAQAKTPITLSLTNVPFTEVLKYIGTLANVTFTFDKYAIMVRPATGSGGEAKSEGEPKVKGL